MTYHMEQVHAVPQLEVQNFSEPREKSKYTFPYKLWEILNDPDLMDKLVWWSEDGSKVIANPERYERCVMTRYPDFVRIPTFANFRRLMRHYFFDWEQDDRGLFHFTHPDFKRGRDDLLVKIHPRKHSGRRSSSPTLYLDGTAQSRKRAKKIVHDFDQASVQDRSDNSSISDAPVIARYSEEPTRVEPKISRSISTQTAFTMCPHDSEFIGTVNDGLHYYDFYTLEGASQSYAGFYSPYTGYAANYGPAPLPLNELAYFHSDRNVRYPVNGFAQYPIAGMGSPEQFCLQGYQRPVVLEESRLQLPPKQENIPTPNSEGDQKENLMKL